LRVPVEAYVPLESPYSYKGTGERWNEEELQRVFSRAAVIEVGAMETTKSSSPFFPVTVGGMPGPMGAMGEILLPTNDVWTLKVTKVGLLDRKDDTVEGGKKAINRKWKTWSVLLTGSQLLLFRDSSWATSLLDSPEGHVVIPQESLFKPDELLSVKDAIAVFDTSYTKVCRIFSLSTHRGLMLSCSIRTPYALSHLMVVNSSSELRTKKISTNGFRVLTTQAHSNPLVYGCEL
jgi:hypothetical protein